MANNGVGAQAPLQLSDITRSIDLSEGVVFEPNHALLVGVYHDELSAYRARREWLSTLHDAFLLESGEDLNVKIQTTEAGDWFILSCEFISATARYAFWRITRGQAPEEQYRIESAHVASIWERASMCPDLKPASSDEHSKGEKILAGLDLEAPVEAKSLVERIVGSTREFFQKKRPEA